MLNAQVLKTVLPHKIVNCCDVDGTTVWFRKIESTSTIRWGDYAINIHELMSRCKKWLHVEHDIVVLTKMYSVDSFGVSLHQNDDQLTFIRKFKRVTEYGAIFKACTWVMENKYVNLCKEKQLQEQKAKLRQAYYFEGLENDC